jgi:SAM-dependent methyltransferase
MGKSKKVMKKIQAGMISAFMLALLSTAGQQQKRPDVPYVPTPEKVVAEMLKLAEVGEKDVLYDLGCGDGRIVITAALERDCRGVGIDISPQRIEESRKNAILAGVEHMVDFYQMDLFEADISQATVVTLYLLSSVNLRLRPRLIRELKPGTRVVSHDFSMGDWASDKHIVVDEKFDYVPVQNPRLTDDYWNKHDVYFWVIPANVSGVWNWTLPDESGKKSYRLEIHQDFQMLKGQALENSTPLPLEIKNGKIEGDKLEFTLDRNREGTKERLHFVGFIKGHTIEGQVKVEGKSEGGEKWTAKREPSTRNVIEK